MCALSSSVLENKQGWLTILTTCFWNMELKLWFFIPLFGECSASLLTRMHGTPNSSSPSERNYFPLSLLLCLVHEIMLTHPISWCSRNMGLGLTYPCIVLLWFIWFLYMTVYSLSIGSCRKYKVGTSIIETCSFFLLGHRLLSQFLFGMSLLGKLDNLLWSMPNE